MARMPLDIVSLDHFTVVGPNRQLIAEESDLRNKNLFRQVWDDACDVGFIIRSHHTGREVTFALYSQVTDSDGDVTAWHFDSLDEDVNWRVTILND